MNMTDHRQNQQGEKTGKGFPWCPCPFLFYSLLDIILPALLYLGFPGSSVVKNPPANAGDPRDVGSIPRLGRSPGRGNGNSVQYSCLGDPMDRGTWWATVHGVASSWTRLSTHTHSACYVYFFHKLLKNSS